MPEWRNDIRQRLHGAQLRPEREAEIVDEVSQHLDERYAEELLAGKTTEAAEAAAWRELEIGDWLAQQVRRAEPASRPLPPIGESARGRFFSALWQDVRYAVRRLAKRPAFALTALVTLALTIGPATTVVGVADALFFRMPPGVAQPERLVFVDTGTVSSGQLNPRGITYAGADAVVERSATVAALTAAEPFSASLSVRGSETQRVDGQAVRWNFFQVLGVQFVAGRPLTIDEDIAPLGAASVVLSAASATLYFGGTDAAIGQTVAINNVPFTVIGVAAKDFVGAQTAPMSSFWIAGNALVRATQFLPLKRRASTATQGPLSQQIARLKPGATAEAAVKELDALVKTLPPFDPARPMVSGVMMRPGLGAPKSLNTNGMTIVRVLAWVAAALVLLGIANVANLLMFQGLKLGREVALRKALGASAARLVQMSLVESLLLSVTGAGLGILVAIGIERVLSDVAIRNLGTLDVPLDWRVVGTTGAIALVTGLVFGVGPGLLAARNTNLASLGAGGRSDTVRGARTRQWLAGAQLALALTLLIGAMFFLATLRNLRAADVGYNPDHVTTMAIDMASQGYDLPRTWDFYRQLIDRVSAQSGVEHAAIGTISPGVGLSYMVPVQWPSGGARNVPMGHVSAGYFDALHIPVVRGRAFTPAESFVGGDPDSVILSSTVAHALFGDADPIGKTVRTGSSKTRDFQVVGVVGDVRWRAPSGDREAVIYFPFGEDVSAQSGRIIARSSREPGDMMRIFRAAAAEIDPAAPMFKGQTVSDAVNTRIAQERLFAIVTALLGAIAFVLAAIGLHGVVSQMVAERSREFGIRVAIGASNRDVVGLVLTIASRITIGGLVVGIGVALLAGKYISAYLYGVTTRDPLLFASAAALLTVVVAIAVIAPVRAALRVQPIDVLRAE